MRPDSRKICACRKTPPFGYLDDNGCDYNDDDRTFIHHCASGEGGVIQILCVLAVSDMAFILLRSGVRDGVRFLPVRKVASL